MSSKKVINGQECEKVEVVSLNINGELSENSFTGEYISELSKDGPIIMNVDTHDSVQEDISTFSINEPDKNDLTNTTSNEDILNDKKNNKPIFIAIGVIAIILIGILLIV